MYQGFLILILGQRDDTGDGGEEAEQHRPSTDGCVHQGDGGGVGTVTRSGWRAT